MTAPDSRDSVERIVAEMRGLWMSGAKCATARGVKEWADRLAALPQQAGGECSMGVGDGSGRLFVHGDYDSIKAAQAIVLERDALQAEVARLRESLSGSRNVLDLLRSVVSAEGVSKFTHVESRSGSLVCVQSTINAIDAALNGGQDDA